MKTEMKYKILNSIILFCISIIIISGQENVEISKKDFKTGKDGLKDAWKAIKTGDEAYKLGGLDYAVALKAYQKAAKYNSNNAELNYKLGVCYFYTEEYQKAAEAFEKASKLKDDVSKDVYYLTGRAYQFLPDYEKAIEQFKKHKSKLSSKEAKSDGENINKIIAGCQNAIELTKNPVNVYVENLGKPLNSAYADYYPVFSGDGTTMYFTSRRENPKSKQNPFDNRYFEDIYSAQLMKDNWERVTNLPKPVNSEDNESVVEIS